MYTAQVWIENYWWTQDGQGGHWSTVFKDKERLKPKTFTSKNKAVQYMTTKNPYCGRKNQRRILKDSQVILEL